MGSPVLKSDKLRATLARNLKSMLASLQWSENELARRSNVSQKQINNITSQRTGCGIDALDAIARAMAVEAWQLLVVDFHKSTDVPSRSARVLHGYLGLPRSEQEPIERLVFAGTKK